MNILQIMMNARAISMVVNKDVLITQEGITVFADLDTLWISMILKLATVSNAPVKQEWELMRDESLNEPSLNSRALVKLQ